MSMLTCTEWQSDEFLWGDFAWLADWPVCKGGGGVTVITDTSNQLISANGGWNMEHACDQEYTDMIHFKTMMDGSMLLAVNQTYEFNCADDTMVFNGTLFSDSERVGDAYISAQFQNQGGFNMSVHGDDQAYTIIGIDSWWNYDLSVCDTTETQTGNFHFDLIELALQFLLLFLPFLCPR